jgi:putative DNA primase/helicase
MKLEAILDQAPEFVERPTISLRGGEGAAAVHLAVKVLANAGGFFNRGGALVRVIETREARALGLRLDGEGDIARDEAQPVIVSVAADYLRVRLDELAVFEKRDGRAKKPRVVNCPKDLALGVLALGEWEGISPLRAITRAPFLRSDGSVCGRKGYDVASATLHFPSGEILPIPENPDRAAALAALEELRGPFSQMPFAASMHESAFAAYVLTLATRPILPTAPATIVQSPTAGTGKGLLVDCGTIIVHGSTPAKRSYPQDRDEMRKVLRAVALVGDPVVVFDNVHAGASVGSDSLNLYLTAEAVGDRTLGRSDARRIVNSAVFAFTGNNIGAKADFVRRALAIKLDPNCERPEERSFLIPDLRAHVLQHRPRLLRAVLTMLRAFVVAGAPAPDRPLLGSFEAWDRLVCGCLIWVGLPDPLETQLGIRGDDAEATNAAALFEALEAAFAVTGGVFTVADVKAALAPDMPGRPSPLFQAIAEACATPEQLGYWLRVHKGQIRGGRKLTKQTGNTSGHASWRVAKAG